MDTMTITIIAVLAVAAGGGIMSSVVQWRSRKDERREYQQWIKANASLELERDELQAKYDNERRHTSWAIGRIKDQSASIRSLEKMLKAASKYHYNKWQERKNNDNENKQEEDVR